MRHLLHEPEQVSLRNLLRSLGVAGQIEIMVQVRYADRDWQRVSFVGTRFGTPGPVTMISDTWGQIHVTDPARFGDELNAEWVRRFYAA